MSMNHQMADAMRAAYAKLPVIPTGTTHRKAKKGHMPKPYKGVAAGPRETTGCIAHEDMRPYPGRYS